MSAPQGDGTQISMQSVLDVQKKVIARLMEENIMLQAALADSESRNRAMMEQKD